MNYKKIFFAVLVITLSFILTFNSDSSLPVRKTINNSAFVGADASFLGDKISANSFRITHNKYLCTVDLKQAVENDVGDEWTVADWEDLKKVSPREFSKIKMHKGDEFLLLKNGQKYYSGNRHYFVAKHQGDIPGGFFKHDQIGDNYFTLGSWHNITMRILCVRKSAVNR